MVLDIQNILSNDDNSLDLLGCTTEITRSGLNNYILKVEPNEFIAVREKGIKDVII